MFINDILCVGLYFFMREPHMRITIEFFVVCLPLGTFASLSHFASNFHLKKSDTKLYYAVS